MDLERIEAATALVRGARSIVALTGAGISTPSGIPDFRGDSGLWSASDPLLVASLGGFLEDARRFYRWFQPLVQHMLTARPNPAHGALAALEHTGRLRAVVTQNIDGLHQRAGSRKVFELHGHLRSATCVECERSVPSERLLPLVQRGVPPRCTCGGTFKPDVVFFDEPLPRGIYWLAQRELEQCDLLLVAGTSLEVYPVSDLPLIALRRGARLVIVNKGETYLDDQADVVLHEDVAAALPALARAVDSEDLMLRQAAS